MYETVTQNDLANLFFGPSFSQLPTAIAIENCPFEDTPCQPNCSNSQNCQQLQPEMFPKLVREHDLSPKRPKSPKVRNAKLSTISRFPRRQFYTFNMSHPNGLRHQLIFVVFDDSSTFLRMNVSLRRRNDFRRPRAAKCDTVNDFALSIFRSLTRYSFFSIKVLSFRQFQHKNHHRA